MSPLCPRPCSSGPRNRRLLFEQVREILVHEDGEVTVCPLPAEGASSV